MSVLGAIAALGLILLSTSAGAGESALRARVIILPASFTGAGISPDGTAVLGIDSQVRGGAIWRGGQVLPLEQDPAQRLLTVAKASSRRARVAVDGGAAPGVNVWRRGSRILLAPDGAATDVSANGRVIAGFVRDPLGGEVGMRWLNGTPWPISGQAGFLAHSARALSGSGRTILGIGSFDDGPASRFLWRRGRAIEVEGLPDAVRPVDDAALNSFSSMQLSSDGTTVAHADVVDEVETCHRFVCRVDLDFEAWRSRNAVIELLDPSRQSESIPHGITANGEVIIGSAVTPEGSGGFLWDPTHGMRLLVPLLESLGADFQGFVLESAAGISDDGRRIIGRARDPNVQRAFFTYLAILPPACSDRVDNDGDGRVDFPEDRGCRSRTDRDEKRRPGRGLRSLR